MKTPDVTSPSQSRKEYASLPKIEIVSEEDKIAQSVFFQSINEEDSDDEFPNLAFDKKITLLDEESSLKAIDTTIPSPLGNIKGGALIKITQCVAQERYGDIIDAACEYEKELGGTIISPPREENGILQIQSSKDWIMSIGGWKGMMPDHEIKDYFFNTFEPEKKGNKFKRVEIYQNGLIYPILNHRIHLPKGFSIHGIDITKTWKLRNEEWVSENRTDLSYSQIVRAIQTIKNSFHLEDKQIAFLQLCGLTREIDFPNWFTKSISKKYQDEILQFLDYLNALMFGIEASGLNAGLVTSLMILDLIADGHLEYQTAFKANNKGGFYPFANFGDNKGTYTNREKIFSEENDSMRTFRKNPSHAPIALKEAILIKTWLEYNEVLRNIDYAKQVKTIESAIQDLMKYYFSPWVNREYFLEKFR